MKKLSLLLTILIPLSLLTSSILRADEYIIEQITNTTFNEYAVNAYDSKLVWQGYPNPESSVIYYYDGQTTQELTDSSAWNMFPKISSGGVVWTGNLSSWQDSSGDAMYFDYNSTINLGQVFTTNNPSNHSNINIYENRIVWVDATTQEMMLYDGMNTTILPGVSGARPRISSGGIVYSNGHPYSNHLYLYDWNSVLDLGETTDSDAQNVGPNQQLINGNKVTWFLNVGNYEQNEVMVRDIATGVTTQITNGNIQYGQPGQPVVSGDYVAWADNGNTPSYIKLFDGSQILTLATTSGGTSNPYFGNGFLIWVMAYNGQADIFAYDLTSHAITQITNDNNGESGISVSGKYIAYVSHNGNYNDIYRAYLNHTPVLNTIGDKTVRAGKRLRFTITAADSDEEDALHFTAQNLPQGASFVDNGDRTATFDWRPNFNQAGIYHVFFEVSDGFSSDTEPITITVYNLGVTTAARAIPCEPPNC